MEIWHGSGSESREIAVYGQLNPEFDALRPEEIHDEYSMELPQEVLGFCKIVEAVGGRALVVGGCVRDAIISKEVGRGKIQPKDMDIEVYGITPEDLLRLVDMHFGLEESGTQGQKFEVIKVFGRGRTYDLDISIPRSDNKTGTGTKGFETTSHPEFTIKEAAKRRDLTCNSVSYDPLKEVVYDPYDGIRDIKNNELRITDPEKFKEDPVRILRIMQFLARFEGAVDLETEELCSEMMDKDLTREIRNRKIIVGGTKKETERSLRLISKSSVELDDESNNRIYDEFKKLLVKGRRPSLGLEFARRAGVVDRYFPWLAELTITEQEYRWHKEGNAWKHTLQVVDAAADIARRENLNETDTLTLVFSALCHDLGKPTKTEIKLKLNEEGVMVPTITSDGHDSEGGWLADEFINALAPKAEENFEADLRNKVKVLTEEHMRPKFCYNQHKDGKNTRKMLGGLARRLSAGGTNIYMLSLLAEADQRGRNGESDIPSKREDVDELVEWQTWINEISTEYKLFEKLPEKILTAKAITKHLGIQEGPMLGVLVKWVFDDQVDGVFENEDQGMILAQKYLEVIKKSLLVAEETGLFVRSTDIKYRSNKPEVEILIWMKREGIKDLILEEMKVENLLI